MDEGEQLLLYERRGAGVREKDEGIRVIIENYVVGTMRNVTHVLCWGTSRTTDMGQGYLARCQYVDRDRKFINSTASDGPIDISTSRSSFGNGFCGS